MADQSIERELLDLLRFGGLEKDHLAELVKIIAGIKNAGLSHLKVFPIGIPAVDGLGVKAVAPSSSFVALVNKIVLETPQASNVVLFPYGVPAVTEVGFEFQVR